MLNMRTLGWSSTGQIQQALIMVFVFLVAVIKILLSSLHAPTAHSFKRTSSLETLWSFAVWVVYQGKVL